MRAAWLLIILAAVVRVVAAQQPPGGRAVAEYSDVTSGAKALADAARLKAIMPTHALDDEEVLRVVKAPFGPERATFAEHQYPGAGGADHVRSLGFTWEKGVLHSCSGSYVDRDLRDLVQLLGLRWYEVQGLDQVKWQDLHADIIFRPDIPKEQKLEALAELIRQETGQIVTFQKTLQKRTCIQLEGGTDRAGFTVPNDGTQVVVLTTGAWDDKAIAKWARAKDEYRANLFRSASFKDAAAFLDAPFLDDEKRHGELDEIDLFLIPAATRLKRTDADYEAKLKRVLENLKAQVGGDWQVVEKELEIYIVQLKR